MLGMRPRGNHIKPEHVLIAIIVVIAVVVFVLTDGSERRADFDYDDPPAVAT